MSKYAELFRLWLKSLKAGAEMALREKTRAMDKVCMSIKSIFKESVKASGHWQIKCFEGGKLKWVDGKPINHNLVVTTGLNHVADQLSDQGESAMSHMACGTDNTAPAAGDTTLVAELARVALDSATQTTNTVAYVATFGAGVGTGTWEEVGILNAGGGGVLLDRLLTGTKVKNAGETFEVTITLTISAA